MSRLKELADKLFNMKPNEQVIKSLKDEIVIPKDILSEGFKAIEKYIGK